VPGGPTGNVAETREQQNSDGGADDRLSQIHHACGSTASRNCANGTCVNGGFTWLVGEDEIESSPMERVPQAPSPGYPANAAHVAARDGTLSAADYAGDG
jgi:hypothetical protein